MAARERQSFGRRGFGRESKAQGLSPAPPRKSPHQIYREGETPRPTFHNSHAELHWPKYGGAVAVFLAAGYLIYSGGYGPFTVAIVPFLLGFSIYFSLNRLRKSATDLYVLRTEGTRSRAFVAGAVAGLLYFLYSTLFGDGMILWLEWSGPRPKFGDGLQRQDLAAVALQIIKALGMMAFGGWLFQFAAKRLGGATGEESEDAR
jgi:hypothetical protein